SSCDPNKQSGSKGKGKPSGSSLSVSPSSPRVGAFFEKIGLLSRNLFGGPVCSYQYSRDVENCQTFPFPGRHSQLL
ncbi:hypothetical protein PUN28_020196, partial [Cardiocondyla obscurior]